MIIAVSVSSILAVVVTKCVYNYLLRKPKLPNLDTDKWWGDGERPVDEDTAIRLFKIDFQDELIQDLKARIQNKRTMTRNLDGINSEYGINIPYLEKILEYWVEEYDFKERVELLNKFPHYKTRIQGLDIHYIRVEPEKDRGLHVVPLLLLHGWPSSSKEFCKIIPLLTKPRDGYDFVFEVIAADLPGFGFSQGTKKVGLNAVQIGIIMRNLMRRLGYSHYFLHAGDWGSQCATNIATLFPNEILGFHTSMALSSAKISNLKFFIASLFPRLIFSRKEMKYADRVYPLKNLLKYLVRESGYFHLQMTKPDTVGVALTDSPSGLAAYIIEKMAICSNRDQLDTAHGGLAELDIDDVLDTITIVWMNNCIVTSMRLYSEGYSTLSPEIQILHEIPTKVPTAATKFKYEVVYEPDSILRDKFPTLLRSTVYDFGGHFAALQTPEVLADDIFDSTIEFLNYHEEHNSM